MKKLSFLLSFAFSTLTATTYYSLDNATPISSDDIYNDPFLALRTKTTGSKTTFSIDAAWKQLAEFSCPEWDEDRVIETSEEYEVTSSNDVRVLNQAAVFDHVSPTFFIGTNAKKPEEIYWQISRDFSFSEVVTNFDEVQQFTKEISIPLISQTFLNPNENYYFRFKVSDELGWTEWSVPFCFQVVKPVQPKEVSCTFIEAGRYELSWQPDDDADTRYIVFGCDNAAFIPSIYGERSDNILKETAESELVVSDQCSYYRVVAVRNGCYSIPSELVVAEDFTSLLTDLEPSFGKPVTAYTYNPHVQRDVWDKLAPYFLPYNHPARRQLDKIFKKKSRVLQDIHSLKKAGFRHPKARQWTRLIVTSHKKVPGMIVKLYTDHQHPHRGKPEWSFWVRRIRGVNLIRNMINERQLNGIFKAPHKWIYPVPHQSKPIKSQYRKNFILVEDDMDILSDPENEKRWRSSHVTTRKLDLLFEIMEGLGLWDCPKPANIPFGKDGRIAFIDTQSYHTWPVKHFRLTPFLAPEMQTHWNQLIKTAR